MMKKIDDLSTYNHIEHVGLYVDKSSIFFIMTSVHFLNFRLIENSYPVMLKFPSFVVWLKPHDIKNTTSHLELHYKDLVYKVKVVTDVWYHLVITAFNGVLSIYIGKLIVSPLIPL